MGWLEAELDAQEFVVNPANADAIAAMAEAQTEKIDRSVLKASSYGLTNGWHNQAPVDFVISDDAKSLLAMQQLFLQLEEKACCCATIRPEGVMGQFAERVLESVALPHQ